MLQGWGIFTQAIFFFDFPHIPPMHFNLLHPVLESNKFWNQTTASENFREYEDGKTLGLLKKLPLAEKIFLTQWKPTTIFKKELKQRKSYCNRIIRHFPKTCRQDFQVQIFWKINLYLGSSGSTPWSYIQSLSYTYYLHAKLVLVSSCYAIYFYEPLPSQLYLRFSYMGYRNGTKELCSYLTVPSSSFFSICIRKSYAEG